MRFLLITLTIVVLSTQCYSAGFGDFLKQATEIAESLNKQTGNSITSSNEIRDANKEPIFADLNWSDDFSTVENKISKIFKETKPIIIFDKNNKWNDNQSLGEGFVFDDERLLVLYDTDFFGKYFGNLFYYDSLGSYEFRDDIIREQNQALINGKSYAESAFVDEIRFRDNDQIIRQGSAFFTIPFKKLYKIKVRFKEDATNTLLEKTKEKYGPFVEIKNPAAANMPANSRFAMKPDLFWFDSETETGLYFSPDGNMAMYYNFKAIKEAQENIAKFYIDKENAEKKEINKTKGLL